MDPIQSTPTRTPNCLTYVAKRYSCGEGLRDVILAIDLAHSMNIRAPHVRRVVYQDDAYECIFDRLRRVVQRMRSQTSPTAGSLGTGMVRTFWLEDYYGIPPRSSSHVITSLVNFWYNSGTLKKERAKTKQAHEATWIGPIKQPQPLVFTHHDLAPRNLIMGPAGDLCIVDWDFAGWYPPFFEHAGMHNFPLPEGWGWMGIIRWILFAWIATGYWRKEREILLRAQRNAIGDSIVRKYSIKAGVTPSTKLVTDPLV
ncbi:hypothetical protein F4825DRAFT_474296 [Nemania diffusa]|nr:hypothetical protein F4825DRAFT_474296 [Nemania diffusa]